MQNNSLIKIKTTMAQFIGLAKPLTFPYGDVLVADYSDLNKAKK